jgi:hypothetical protein
MDVEFKPFSGSVNLDLLPRILKGLQVLVARIGDILILSSALMEESGSRTYH